MINTFAQKLVTSYDNLPPKRKALADIVGMLFTTIICVTIVVAIASYGLWMEMAFGLLIYSLCGMIGLLYKSRVAHYEFQEKYSKK